MVQPSAPGSVVQIDGTDRERLVDRCGGGWCGYIPGDLSAAFRPIKIYRRGKSGGI